MSPSPIAARPLRSAGLVLLLATLFAVLALPGHAAEAPAKTPLETYAGSLADIERQIAKDKTLGEDELKAWMDRISGGRTPVADCIAKADEAIARLRADLATLGEAAKGEAADVARKRKEVQQAIAEQERHLAECRVLQLQSEELSQRIAERLKVVVAARLFARGPSLPALLVDNWHSAPMIGTATVQFVQLHAGLANLTRAQWLWFALLVAVAFSTGALLRRAHRRRLAAHPPAADATIGVGPSLLAATVHYLPQLLASTAAAVFVYALTHTIRPVPFVNVLLYGLPVYVLTLIVIHWTLAPRPPMRKLLAASDELTRKMARRLRVLALLTFFGYLVFSTLLAQHLPEEAYLLTRGVYAGLLFLNMIWALRLLARMREKDELRWLRLLMVLVLAVSLAAEWIGYRNLALGIIRSILGSLIALGVTLVASRLFHELHDALEQGEGTWPRRVRHLLGVAPGHAIPGMLWLRVATNLLLWALFGYALLRIWQVSAATIQQIEDYIVRGFPLGTFQLVPVRILAALALFALLVTLARWMQTRLDRHWLRYARLEHGAREAVVTISGYVMITVAAIVGLAVAGFEFGNLAIIAGALSVGIGFGLQNIVNNFISGLILLFERPVKTGDWVVVGSTEGYVKRIRIRSTQIQTFDRADVIVPNSELISQQVTNWMLYDTQGRARIPVGVAYGSDTQKVKSILERLAREHPNVITNGSYPDPKVLFLGFGDSALNFELRCFVRNIDDRLLVISDLNFAIDAAFRAEGIEIPFPQRDLHVRSWPGSQPPPAPPPESESGSR